MDMRRIPAYIVKGNITRLAYRARLIWLDRGIHPGVDSACCLKCIFEFKGTIATALRQLLDPERSLWKGALDAFKDVEITGSPNISGI
ncbi:hypothetical protein FQR65_LT18469 [Abscondita terminalis]|nr:hypothetical protein FQR65_LT18469 [Abscondita terminalis]